jgi:hypothetical protein
MFTALLSRLKGITLRFRQKKGWMNQPDMGDECLFVNVFPTPRLKLGRVMIGKHNNSCQAKPDERY